MYTYFCTSNATITLFDWTWLKNIAASVYLIFFCDCFKNIQSLTALFAGSGFGRHKPPFRRVHWALNKSQLNSNERARFAKWLYIRALIGCRLSNWFVKHRLSMWQVPNVRYVITCFNQQFAVLFKYLIIKTISNRSNYSKHCHIAICVPILNLQIN